MYECVCGFSASSATAFQSHLTTAPRGTAAPGAAHRLVATDAGCTRSNSGAPQRGSGSGALQSAYPETPGSGGSGSGTLAQGKLQRPKEQLYPAMPPGATTAAGDDPSHQLLKANRASVKGAAATAPPPASGASFPSGTGGGWGAEGNSSMSDRNSDAAAQQQQAHRRSQQQQQQQRYNYTPLDHEPTNRSLSPTDRAWDSIGGWLQDHVTPGEAAATRSGSGSGGGTTARAAPRPASPSATRGGAATGQQLPEGGSRGSGGSGPGLMRKSIGGGLMAAVQEYGGWFSQAAGPAGTTAALASAAAAAAAAAATALEGDGGRFGAGLAEGGGGAGGASSPLPQSPNGRGALHASWGSVSDGSGTPGRPIKWFRRSREYRTSREFAPGTHGDTGPRGEAVRRLLTWQDPAASARALGVGMYLIMVVGSLPRGLEYMQITSAAPGAALLLLAYNIVKRPVLRAAARVVGASPDHAVTELAAAEARVAARARGAAGAAARAAGDWAAGACTLAARALGGRGFAGTAWTVVFLWGLLLLSELRVLPQTAVAMVGYALVFVIPWVHSQFRDVMDAAAYDLLEFAALLFAGCDRVALGIAAGAGLAAWEVAEAGGGSVVVRASGGVAAAFAALVWRAAAA